MLLVNGIASRPRMGASHGQLYGMLFPPGLAFPIWSSCSIQGLTSPRCGRLNSMSELVRIPGHPKTSLGLPYSWMQGEMIAGWIPGYPLIRNIHGL
jgi:hypothetical protein